MTYAAHVLLLLTVAGPLSAALFIPFIRHPLRLLPWAALPGLTAALLAPRGETIELAALVLGVSFEIDRAGAVFLGFGSLVWLLAGAYACSYLRDSERVRTFSAFWLLTLAGSLSTFIAADVVTFYISFSLMSLSAYGLVIHDRTASARRAGLVYIVLAVFGEAVLVAAFILAATGADSLTFADVRSSFVTSPWSGYVLAGLLVGFGIKAGLVPLHVWLPLAHPEAPTPASAVLSGVIVKAGIIGLMRMLPMEVLAPEWSGALVLIGLVTTYYGVAAGLLQTNAKAVLAYSTLSQMGLVAAVIGSVLGTANAGHMLDAVTLYVTHHGLAKGALFLSVGIVAAVGMELRRPVLVVTALTAFAIAGLPLSGGALAKLAIKDTLGDGMAALLVELSAVTTAMLMLRFMWILAEQRGSATEPAYGLVIPWAVLTAASVVMTWMLFPTLSDQTISYALSPINLWTALWPILVASGAAAIVLWRGVGLPVAVPQGDLVVPAEALFRRLVPAITELAAPLTQETIVHQLVPTRRPPEFLETAELALRRWSVSGPVLILVAFLIGFALAIG